MHPFSFVAAESPQAASAAMASDPNAVFFAGGTTLIDLMKLDVMTPRVLVDISHLAFSEIAETPAGISIGANVRNSDLAHHQLIRERFPMLTEALLSGASAQLRNMATTAGNLLQRTRCGYFRDVHTKCNKRQPSSGCDAITGINRGHAVLGTSDKCIATHPSDMCVAMVALEAVIKTLKQNGEARTIPITDFYLLPGDTPEHENVLEKGELITAVLLPNDPIAQRSHYLKVRDRASYEFALASAAVALELEGEIIRRARVAMGGVATVPWRSKEAEAGLQGKPANTETFRRAADAALAGAVPRQHNAFKIELAKRTLVEALHDLTESE
jgi:xanthine dehydrogenase YagS FAD-binding subunit